MKYEICKRNTDGKTWSMIAWSDTWNWAKEIADSLNWLNDKQFAIFKDGQKIETMDKAMEVG